MSGCFAFTFNMDKILLIIIPFLAAIMLRRIGVIRDKHAVFLTAYVINFSLPCLTIPIITGLDFKHGNFSVALIALLAMSACALLAYYTGKLLKLKGNKLRSFILIVTFPNTCFVGYPLTYAFYGAAGLPYAVIYDQMGMLPLFLTLGFFVAGGRESLGSALKFPPFLALLFAVALNFSGMQIPAAVTSIMKAIGWTTLPLTIFLIGMKITFQAIHDAKAVAASIILRMLIGPALLFAVMKLLGMDGLPYDVALLETAMPPALVTSILAMKYKLDEEFTVASISAGTVLCMIVFAIFIMLGRVSG